jgi:hypothetical protein
MVDVMSDWLQTSNSVDVNTVRRHTIHVIDPWQFTTNRMLIQLTVVA